MVGSGSRRALYRRQANTDGDEQGRGNRYLRKLFVQGAHAVLQQRMKQSNCLNTWLAQLTSRKRIQVAAVALANKMARIVWAVLSKGEAYRPFRPIVACSEPA